ncbi:MAG: EamA/RhaT family transporter, partial [Alphaproteobacteria bacterium]
MPDTSRADPAGGGDKPAVGIALMVLALFLLASMDAIAKHLTESLAVPQILAIRFWIFFLFAMAMAGRSGFRRTLRSGRPRLQVLRALVLVLEMTAFIFAFSRMPLADVHAIAAVSPLLVMALAAA